MCLIKIFVFRKYFVNEPADYFNQYPEISYTVRSEIKKRSPRVPARKRQPRNFVPYSPPPAAGPSTSISDQFLSLIDISESFSTRPNASEWNQRKNLRDQAAYRRHQLALELDKDLKFRRVGTPSPPPMPVISEEKQREESSDTDSDSILIIDASPDSSFEVINYV